MKTPMEFRTKREAEEAAKDRDIRADWEANAALDYERHDWHGAAAGCRKRHDSFRAEAARIRALLPTLPE